MAPVQSLPGPETNHKGWRAGFSGLPVTAGWGSGEGPTEASWVWRRFWSRKEAEAVSAPRKYDEETRPHRADAPGATPWSERVEADRPPRGGRGAGHQSGHPAQLGGAREEVDTGARPGVMSEASEEVRGAAPGGCRAAPGQWDRRDRVGVFAPAELDRRLK